MPVLLLGNIFLLLCNENILFNRVKNIVFVLLFNKGNRKHFFKCSIELQKHLCQFERTRNNVETLALRARVPPDYFSFSQTSTRVYITLQKHGKCFLILKYNIPGFQLYRNDLTQHGARTPYGTAVYVKNYVQLISQPLSCNQLTCI